MTDESAVGEVELKVCPFCGSNKIVIAPLQHDMLCISCTACNLAGGCFRNREFAEIAWNTRANEINKSEYDWLKLLEKATRPGLYQRVHDDEYQRLKRLEENVKREINNAKKSYVFFKKTYGKKDVATKNALNINKLLESLEK